MNHALDTRNRAWKVQPAAQELFADAVGAKQTYVLDGRIIAQRPRGTLSGLAQTSVLSVGSDRIDMTRLQLCFELGESTSASGLLLSSIDGARAQFVREGEELLDRALSSARLLRERLAAEVPELR